MGFSSILIAIVAFAVLFIAVALLWWLRYNEKKSVVQIVSRHPHPYLGRRANHIYNIPLTRNFIYQTPPPTFSKAVKFPVPPKTSVSISIEIEDVPPPTYEQYLETQDKKLAPSFDTHGSILPN